MDALRERLILPASAAIRCGSFPLMNGSAWTSTLWPGPSPRIGRQVARRSSLSEPQERSTPAPSTIWQASRSFARNSNSGFMWTAPLVRWPCSRLNWPRGSRELSRPTLWHSIFTSGHRCLTMPASSWCATARSTSRRLVLPRRTSCGRSAECRPVRPGLATSGLSSRGAFALSRPGQR